MKIMLSTTFMLPELPLEAGGEAAALALAEDDLRAAERWLTETAPGSESALGTRRYVLRKDWAAQHPEQAMALLSDPEFADAHHGLATGILFAESTRAREVLQALVTERARETALGNAISDFAHILESDAFPTPGGVNRLPNFRERYDALRVAVDGGGFEERTRARMLDQLERGFQRVLGE